MGQQQSKNSRFYFKSIDQWLVEPRGVYKNAKTSIMGISTKVYFEFIIHKEGYTSFTSLVSWPWGRKMKFNISLENI